MVNHCTKEEFFKIRAANCSLLSPLFVLCSPLSEVQKARTHTVVFSEWSIIVTRRKFLKYGRQTALCSLLSPLFVLCFLRSLFSAFSALYSLLSALCSLLSALCSLISPLFALCSPNSKKPGRIQSCYPKWSIIVPRRKFLKYGRQTALCSLLSVLCSLLSEVQKYRTHTVVFSEMVNHCTKKEIFKIRAANCSLLSPLFALCSLLSALRSLAAKCSPLSSFSRIPTFRSDVYACGTST